MIHMRHAMMFISKIQDFVNPSTSSEALLLLIVSTGRLVNIFYLCKHTRAYVHTEVVPG